MKEEHYKMLLKKKKDLERELAFIEGAEREIKETIRTKYSCEDLKEAKKLMEELDFEIGEVVKQLRKEVEDFQKEHKDLLK